MTNVLRFPAEKAGDAELRVCEQAWRDWEIMQRRAVSRGTYEDMKAAVSAFEYWQRLYLGMTK